MNSLRCTFALLFGAAVAFSAGGAHAQDDSLVIEEIVVTAQKREQRLQDVPISISVISGEKIEQAGIDNLDDLALYVPNFSKGESGGGAILQMRGIGTGANPAFEQSVTLYMDDISLARGPLARMPLMDLERVEVLRGPQNVLFGKNAIAGAISMITAKPTDEFEGSLSMRYEPDFDDSEAIAVLSGPLGDKLRGRLAVRYADYGGYYENEADGKNEERREEMAVRGTLAWDVGTDAEATFKFEHNSIDSEGQPQELIFGYDSLLPGFEGLDYTETAALFALYYNLGVFGPPNADFPFPLDIGSDDISMDRVRSSVFDAYQEMDLSKFQLTYEQDYDGFTFTSVTGYVEYDEDRLGAGAFGGLDISTVQLQEEYEQLSQEIRFTSDTGGKLEWIAGAFFQTWDLEASSTTFIDTDNVVVLAGLTFGPPVTGLESVANIAGTLAYNGESTSSAIFGQFAWNLSDTARFILGGRYTRESKKARRVNDSINQLTGEPDFTQMIFASCFQGIDYNSLGKANQLVAIPGCDGVARIGNFNTHDVNGKRTENFFTPSATLEVDFGASSMFYVTASQGFKAGGFDARGVAEADWEFEDEEVTGYELGLKSTFADGRAQASIAYFDSDYDDLQVTTFDGVARFAVGNAAEYSAEGIEADGRWRVTDNLTLAGSLAWIDAKYVSYESSPGQEVVCNARFAQLNPVEAAGGCSRTGQTPSNTPEFSGNLILDYLKPFSNNLSFRATLDVNYEGEYDTEPTKEAGLVQDAYTKYNLRLALEGERWTLAVLGKNLTDEDVIEFSGIEALTGSFFAAPTYYGYLQPPRTIAAQLDLRF